LSADLEQETKANKANTPAQSACITLFIFLFFKVIKSKDNI